MIAIRCFAWIVDHVERIILVLQETSVKQILQLPLQLFQEDVDISLVNVFENGV